MFATGRILPHCACPAGHSMKGLFPAAGPDGRFRTDLPSSRSFPPSAATSRVTTIGKILLWNEGEIILLDMLLPGMDGLDVVRKRKAGTGTHDIHIVAITSYPEKLSKTEVLEADCDTYLLKPLRTPTLPRELADVVARGGAST
ncbi:MAG: two-component system, cell cycle response regulator [Thermoanaerobaculia bacterium]|jgi:CheY-like chemotaxis protein|nr:two-component system, cell cycle response regulator [Thermoanaerobaculia bacterium]